jgi:glycosyltransferase involved in cell wall biosynthesis
MRNALGTILVVYNRYMSRGGEDEVFESEVELLRKHGWDVVPIVDAPSPPTTTQLLRAATDVVWSVGWHRRFRQLARVHRPRIVHIHNTFPNMSPSIIHAARDAGAAVVHTLHNYRLICPSAICYRDARTCEDCVGRRFAWPGVLHGCYRGSRLQTAGVAASVAVHGLLNTWQDQVDAFISPSAFARNLLTRGGIPLEKIFVKPNFIMSDPGVGEHAGGFCVFVGRISASKGIQTLMRAWKSLEHVPLTVVGDPLPNAMRVPVDPHRAHGVEFLGRVDRSEVLGLMKASRFLIMPSELYEVSPLTILEAFACGLPVVASRQGAMAELVDDGRTGLLFRPGDPNDLRVKVEWAWRHPERMMAMGREARRTYETRYAPERNYQMLATIYESALHRLMSRVNRPRDGDDS